MSIELHPCTARSVAAIGVEVRLLDDLEPVGGEHPPEEEVDEEDLPHDVDQVLGCNSMDIWNLRLELGRKLRQGLRTSLAT